MESRDDTIRDAAAERLQHDHPAQPDQPNQGFETGYDQERDTPEEQLEPNYARGKSEEPPDEERRGRFSTGHERDPDSPEKTVERRFSEGIERNPTSD